MWYAEYAEYLTHVDLCDRCGSLPDATTWMLAYALRSALRSALEDRGPHTPEEEEADLALGQIALGRER